MNIKWKKLFDWSVMSVAEPAPVMNKHGALTGYALEVQYAHHGKRTLFFDIDGDFWYSQYGSPLDAARSFYNKYSAQAAEYRKRSMQQVKAK